MPHYGQLIPKQQLIVLFPRDCPNCASPAGETECDYVCPTCRKIFCSHCYKTDHKGDGTYIFCPQCKAKLYFPATPKSQPEFACGDICTFTNKGSSGVTSNDGKECRITRIKEQEMWVRKNVPEYVILFTAGNCFGATEQELKLVVTSSYKYCH